MERDATLKALAAEQHLAEERRKTLFDTGRYLIKNRRHQNVAKLCNANNLSGVVSDNRQGDTGEMVSSSISLVT